MSHSLLNYRPSEKVRPKRPVSVNLGAAGWIPREWGLDAPGQTVLKLKRCYRREGDWQEAGEPGRSQSLVAP